MVITGIVKNLPFSVSIIANNNENSRFTDTQNYFFKNVTIGNNIIGDGQLTLDNSAAALYFVIILQVFI